MQHYLCTETIQATGTHAPLQPSVKEKQNLCINVYSVLFLQIACYTFSSTLSTHSSHLKKWEFRRFNTRFIYISLQCGGYKTLTACQKINEKFSKQQRFSLRGTRIVNTLTVTMNPRVLYIQNTFPIPINLFYFSEINF